MKNKSIDIFSNKSIFLIGLLICILCISVGYASLNTTLYIAGDAAVRASANIRITSIEPERFTNSSETANSTYTKDTTTMHPSLPVSVATEDESSSVVVYAITITNYSDDDYLIKTIDEDLFNHVNDDDVTNGIDYVIEGASAENTIIEANSSLTFTVKFLYTGENEIAGNADLMLSYTFEVYEDEEESESGILLKDKILSDNGGVTAITNNGTPDFSVAATTDMGMYASTDPEGTTYYFRGAVTDNYVYFNDAYWRIIRITGDGSIRLIYQGATADATGSSSTTGSTSKYNSNTALIGNTDYSSPGKTVYDGSTAETTVNSYFTSNLVDTVSSLSYTSGFCNDVNDTSGTAQVSTGSSVSSSVTYAGQNRLTTTAPTYACAPSDYYYTASNSSSIGNQSLSYPVGLITLDEVMFAGGNTSDNTSYYLYNGVAYWTMTPYSYSYGLFGLGKSAKLAIVSATGSISSSTIQTTNYVRPVINLSSSSIWGSGNGTAENPYVLGTGAYVVIDPSENSSYVNDTLSHVVQLMYEAGDSTISLQDGETNEISDNSYRYSGGTPNNYVCFGSTDATCPSDNLYRIIGVVDGKVKLVSADYATTTMLGGEDVGNYTESSGNYGKYAYNSGDDNSYGSSSTSIAETNLNSYFYNTFSSTWQNMMVDTTWSVGNVGYFSAIEKTASGVYADEMTMSSTYTAKIGILYNYEYAFAAYKNAWGVAIKNYSNTKIKANNWLYKGTKEWTISHGDTLLSTYAAAFAADGSIGYATRGTGLVVRPTFSLASTVKYTGGSGTADNPIRISA